MAIQVPVQTMRTHSRREMKEQRLRTSKESKLYRQERAYRIRFKGAKNDVELANAFRQFGIDYLSTAPESLFPAVKERMSGKRADSIPLEAMNFLTENFDAVVKHDNDMRPIITFPEEEGPEAEGDETPMKLYNQLSELSGQPRKVVRTVYEALVRQVKRSLRKERVFKLPEIGRFKVSYRPPREKRRGRNPFTGKKMWFKEKPASNKLKFASAKPFKNWLTEKVEVVDTRKKKKDKKSKKED